MSNLLLVCCVPIIHHILPSGIKFAKFPPILTLQLKRFGMNWQTLTRVKINSEFYFPETFDAAQFIDPVCLSSLRSHNLLLGDGGMVAMGGCGITNQHSIN